jgi:hypothetical protein
MWICTLEFIYGSCMIVPHHIFFLHFGILEQRASGALDRTRWANIMACSFSKFISLIIHLRGNLMTTAYATEVSDVQDLQLRIQKGSEMIHMTPGTFQRVRQSLFRRGT